MLCSKSINFLMFETHFFIFFKQKKFKTFKKQKLEAKKNLERKEGGEEPKPVFLLLSYFFFLFLPNSLKENTVKIK